jgi:hypothetical protein
MNFNWWVQPSNRSYFDRKKLCSDSQTWSGAGEDERPLAIPDLYCICIQVLKPLKVVPMPQILGLCTHASLCAEAGEEARDRAGATTRRGSLRAHGGPGPRGLRWADERRPGQRRLDGQAQQLLMEDIHVNPCFIIKQRDDMQERGMQEYRAWWCRSC